MCAWPANGTRKGLARRDKARGLSQWWEKPAALALWWDRC